jgi:hypothetical protein
MKVYNHNHNRNRKRGEVNTITSKNGKKKMNLYKTELCESWSGTGECKYGSKCRFAHGIEELNPVKRAGNYRTQLCKTWQKELWCPYGQRCRFIHEQLPTNSFISQEALHPLSRLWNWTLVLPRQ